MRSRSRTRSGSWSVNRVTVPTSTSSRAAPAGPIPYRSIRVDPLRRTAIRSSAVRALSLASTVPRSSIRSMARRRRVASGRVPRPDPGQHPAGLRGAGPCFAPPGISSVSSRCSRLTICTRRWASSSRRPTSSRITSRSSSSGTVRAGRGCAPRQQRSSGRRSVGLAALPGVEHPHPGGQLRRHVQHWFPVAHQPLRQRTPGTVGAFDRPDPGRPLPHVPDQRLVAAAGGREPARGRDRAAGRPPRS